MVNKLVIPCRLPGTKVALVRSFPCVNAEVLDQVGLEIEVFGAQGALVRALACVYHLVSQHGRLVICGVATHKTLARLLLCG